MGTIVIIDDSKFNRKYLKSILEQSGYTEIFLYESFYEALSNLLGTNKQSHSDIRVDLIILDFIMPEVDGITACQIFKNLKHLADVPIIIITSDPSNSNIQLAFDSGATDFISRPFKDIELLSRVRSALRLKKEIDSRKAREKELIALMTQIEEQNKKLEQLSFIDGLTGIPNRRYFDEIFNREWNGAIRNNKLISLLLLDIDDFKTYNDTYGHLSGDDCLKKVAQIIQSVTLRSGDIVARYGGEEFAVLLPGTNEEGAKFVAEKIRAAIENECIAHISSRVRPYVTVSIGCSTILPNSAISLSLLIERADQALYKAKHSGRNCVQITY